MSAAPLWTIAEVAKALGLSATFPTTPIDVVTQDSRLVKPGSLFVALGSGQERSKAFFGISFRMGSNRPDEQKRGACHGQNNRGF